MIAADNKDDMDQWLEIIHRCMEQDSSAPRFVFRYYLSVNLVQYTRCPVKNCRCLISSRTKGFCLIF